MSHKKFLITAMAAFFLFTGSSPVLAKPYGPLTLTLYYTYCKGTRWEKWGCKGYFFYRLDWDRQRSGAMRACNWSCDKQARDIGACKRGCQLAQGYDNN